MVIHETLGPQAPLILGAILIITGLALAFFGHGIVSSLMSLIGALLGSAVGYLFGAAIGQSPLVGLVLAAVGAIIGSILFSKLVKIGLAFLVGILAAALTYTALRGPGTFTPGQIDPPLIVSLLVLLVVFALAYYYIDDLIGVITAAIGGLLLALGIYLLGVTTNVVAALAGLGAFVLGAYVQTKAIRRKRAMRAMAQPPAVAPTPPPPPPPPR